MPDILQSESTAARRRVYFTCVNNTDVTDYLQSSDMSTFTIKISKNGAASATPSGTTITQVDATNQKGLFYWEGASGDFDTLGRLVVTITNTAGSKVMRKRNILVTVKAQDTIFSTTTTADVTKWNGTAVATPNTAGVPRVDVKFMETDTLTSGALATTAVTEIVNAVGTDIQARTLDSNVLKWNGTNVAAPNTAGVPRVDVKFMEANTFTASALATDAVTEIVNAVETELSATHGAGAWVDGGSLTTSAIADAVWDEALSGHSTAGTAGKALQDVNITASTPAAIADAVWDELRASHTTAGSYGEGVNVLTLATNSVNAAALATDAVTEIQTGLATSSALSTAQTTLNTINTKIGTPASSVSADIAAINTKLGTPAGASVSADIAAIKTDTASTLTAATAIETTVLELETVALGRWKIVGSVLTLYQSDGTTPLIAFNLKDDTGAPSGTRIFERVPIP